MPFPKVNLNKRDWCVRSKCLNKRYANVLFQRRLESMKKMNGNSFWSKPIIHPNAHVNSNSPSFWLSNVVGFICGDSIVMTCLWFLANTYIIHFVWGSLWGLPTSVPYVSNFFTHIGCRDGAFMKKTWRNWQLNGL